MEFTPCRKRAFYSVEEAQQSIQENDVGVPLYVYRCENCQLWHKTKQSPAGRRGMRMAQHEEDVNG